MTKPFHRYAMILCGLLGVPAVADAGIVLGDSDGDLDLDLRDWSRLQNCLRTSGTMDYPPECDLLRGQFDSDTDVDLVDHQASTCGFTGPGLLVQAVTVHIKPGPVKTATIEVGGITAGWQKVEAIGDLSPSPSPLATIDGCGFSVELPLRENRINKFFLRGLLPDGTPSTLTPINIVHDTIPPDVFVDYPADNSVITTSITV